jgi:ferritin-like metal-binding protein YciE
MATHHIQTRARRQASERRADPFGALPIGVVAPIGSPPRPPAGAPAWRPAECMESPFFVAAAGADERLCDFAARVMPKDAREIRDWRTPGDGETGMAKTERSGHTTTDHDFIRQWVEERGGWPARVAGTESGSDDAGLIRIDFPGYSGAGSLERIEWEEWFEKFDDSNLAFLHRDLSHGGGDLDRFNKLVRRTGNEDGEGSGRSGGSSSRRSGGSRTASSARKASGSRSTSSSSASRASTSRGTSSRSGGSSSRGSTAGDTSSGGSRGGPSSRSSGSSSRSTGSSSRGTSSSSRSGSGGGGSSRKSASSGTSTSRGSSSRSNGAAAETGGSTEMRELLKHELGDLLFAEKVFLKATKTLAKEAQDPEVKARVEEHVEETQGQIERLNEAFRAIGERPKAEKCPAALGLQEEHDSYKSEEKPSKMQLSAFDLGSGLRVEHYEIAAYRTAIAIASALGERECAGLLKENLKEEMAMASFLEKTSAGVLKRMARA